MLSRDKKKKEHSVDHVSTHITPLGPITAMDDYEDELALLHVALAAQRQEFEETESELQELACAAVIMHRQAVSCYLQVLRCNVIMRTLADG